MLWARKVREGRLALTAAGLALTIATAGCTTGDESVECTTVDEYGFEIDIACDPATSGAEPGTPASSIDERAMLMVYRHIEDGLLKTRGCDRSLDMRLRNWRARQPEIAAHLDSEAFSSMLTDLGESHSASCDQAPDRWQKALEAAVTVDRWMAEATEQLGLDWEPRSDALQARLNASPTRQLQALVPFSDVVGAVLAPDHAAPFWPTREHFALLVRIAEMPRIDWSAVEVAIVGGAFASTIDTVAPAPMQAELPAIVNLSSPAFSAARSWWWSRSAIRTERLPQRIVFAVDIRELTLAPDLLAPETEAAPMRSSLELMAEWQSDPSLHNDQPLTWFDTASVVEIAAGVQVRSAATGPTPDAALPATRTSFADVAAGRVGTVINEDALTALGASLRDAEMSGRSVAVFLLPDHPLLVQEMQSLGHDPAKERASAKTWLVSAGFEVVEDASGWVGSHFDGPLTFSAGGMGVATSRILNQ